MIENISDFIAIKRYGYSLLKLKERYPDGCPDHIIAKALEISEDEVEERYQRIIACIKSDVDVN